MPSEQETLDMIFAQKRKGKFRVQWCDLCRCFDLICPNKDCGHMQQCEECRDERKSFNMSIKTPSDYLTADENRTVLKHEYLKRYLKICLENDFDELNWEFIGTEGYASDFAIELFPILKNHPYKKD